MKHSSLWIQFACTASLAALARAQQVLGSAMGNAGDRFGAAAITIGDQDGDGVPDVVVGAPGHNGGNGAVYCVSGRTLSSPNGVIVIWVIVPVTAQQPSAFGTSLALVGNVVGDSTPDFVIGAPNLASAGATTGAIYVIDGHTSTTASVLTGASNSHTGRSLAAVGDQNGDGVPDLMLTTSSTLNTNLRVSFLTGTALQQSGSLNAMPLPSLQWGAYSTGENLTTGFDLDHDGRFDLAIGAPLNSTMTMYRADGSWTYVGMYSSNDTSERACASISAASDYDGDGSVDFLIGAPNWNDGTGTEHGRVIVVSGASILTPHYPPVVIASLSVPQALQVAANMHFGARVLAVPDLNGDGAGDILAGAPDHLTANGAVSVFSGATLARIGGHVGAANEHLGDALLAGLPDLNADGFPDFAVGGSLADDNGLDSGVLACLSLFPAAPSSYCTAKTNSLGCVPAMASSGIASVSSTAAFAVTCANVLNVKTGLMFYSHAPDSVPFQGGVFCVATPVIRTLPQNSGGIASGNNCTGSFSFDFNARIDSGVDPTLVVGAEVFAQYWSRDPAVASTTNLSDALRFLINP